MKHNIFFDYVFLVLVVVSLNFSIFQQWVDAHEDAHARSCEYLGGNATITYSNFGLSGETRCSIKTLEFERISALLEATGYQVRVGIYATMINSVVLLVSFVILLNRGDVNGK